MWKTLYVLLPHAQYNDYIYLFVLGSTDQEKQSSDAIIFCLLQSKPKPIAFPKPIQDFSFFSSLITRFFFDKVCSPFPIHLLCRFFMVNSPNIFKIFFLKLLCCCPCCGWLLFERQQVKTIILRSFMDFPTWVLVVWQFSSVIVYQFLSNSL